jgi:hypothetical protein
VLALLSQGLFYGNRSGRHSAGVPCGGFQPVALLLYQFADRLLLPESFSDYTYPDGASQATLRLHYGFLTVLK